MKKIISNININNRNNLIRELLSGITEEELKQLVKIRKSVKKPVPTPRNLDNKDRRKYPKFGMVDEEPVSTHVIVLNKRRKIMKIASLSLFQHPEPKS